jgi:hypothetical protein
LQVLDISELCGKIESLLGQASPADRRAMLAIYLGFHRLADDDHRRPSGTQVLDEYQAELETCCIELLIVRLLFGPDSSWSVEQWETAFDGYLRHKHNHQELNLPALFEVAIEAQIANMYLEAGNASGSRVWMDRAILDGCGNTEAQSYLSECKEKTIKVNLRQLLGRPSSEDTTA